MNQAERDMLTFFNANDVTTPLPVGLKSVLHCLKLFSCYCENNGESIMDWMKVSKAQFDQFRSSNACMWGIEKVTIPPCPKTRLVNATMPRNVTSSTMVTPAPMINFSSASPDVKVVDSPLVKQTPPKSPAYHAVPEKHQAILHDFLLQIDHGSFGIPCGGQIYHSSPGMNHAVWSLKKSALLPKTLAQLACQDFKKKPPDCNTGVLSPQYSYASHILQQVYFGSIVGACVSLWPKCHPSSLTVCPKSLPQDDFGNALVMSKTCHAVGLIKASHLIPRMLSHVLKLTAGWSQMFAKAPIHDLAGYGINDIDGTIPKSHASRLYRNGTFPKSQVSIFYRNGTFPKLCLTSCQWNSLHPDTQAKSFLLTHGSCKVQSQ